MGTFCGDRRHGFSAPVTMRHNRYPEALPWQARATGWQPLVATPGGNPTHRSMGRLLFAETPTRHPDRLFRYSSSWTEFLTGMGRMSASVA